MTTTVEKLQRATYQAVRIKKFRTAARLLNELAADGFHIYLASGTLNLMSGEHHEGKGTARCDRIIDSVTLRNADGGDW